MIIVNTPDKIQSNLEVVKNFFLRDKIRILSNGVEVEWLTCKNLQVSCKFLQGDASPWKFFSKNLQVLKS